MNKQAPALSFATLIQDYFVQRLINQRNASDKTIAAYRDTFKLLIDFAQTYYDKPVTALCLSDFTAPVIVAFLQHLESERHNTVRSRNARLAAIHSFMHFAALKAPTDLTLIQSVLAIPMKRYERPLVSFLTREEINAILNAPDPTTWSGRRDRTMFATMYNTGARVAEIVALRRCDVDVTQHRCVALHGKGRKERVIPLWKNTVNQIRRWTTELDQKPRTPLFPNRYGNQMSRSGVENRIKEAVSIAIEHCPSLKKHRVSPHVLRHTTAMHLLQSGVDLTVIAMWLGHESVETTHHYIEADLAMKQRALSVMTPPNTSTKRYKPKKDLLAFLEEL